MKENTEVGKCVKKEETQKTLVCGQGYSHQWGCAGAPP